VLGAPQPGGRPHTDPSANTCSAQPGGYGEASGASGSTRTSPLLAAYGGEPAGHQGSSCSATTWPPGSLTVTCVNALKLRRLSTMPAGSRSRCRAGPLPTTWSARTGWS